MLYNDRFTNWNPKAVPARGVTFPARRMEGVQAFNTEAAMIHWLEVCQLWDSAWASYGGG